MRSGQVMLVAFAIFVTGFASMITILISAPKVANGATVKYDDLSATSEAQTRADITTDHYLPMAAAYSVSETSHKQRISVNSYGNLEKQFKDSIIPEARSYLERNYMNRDPERCDYSYPDISLGIKEGDSENVTVELSSGEPLVTLNCFTNDVEVTYSPDTEKVERKNGGNRLTLIAEKMKKLMEDRDEKASSVDNTGSGSVSTVCYSTKTSARTAARNNANSQIDSGLSSIESTMESELSEDSVDVGATAVRSRSDISRSVSNVNSNRCSCEERNEDGECIDWDYDATADYSYTYNEIAMDYRGEDKKYKIPVESSFKHLVLFAEYSHSLG